MIIGMCGVASSGKDTSADFFVKKYGLVKIAFADVLKRACKEFFDFSDDQLWGPSSRRNEADERYLRRRGGRIESRTIGIGLDGNLEVQSPTYYEEWADEYLTPRYALQKLGTEFGRDCYENVWVEYALRIADKLLYKSGILRSVHYSYTPQDGLEVTSTPIGPKPMGVVFSDVRFKNEIDAIHKKGGKVIRLLRGEGLEGAARQHRSETEQKNLPDSLFDAVIDNQGYTLDGLYTHLSVVFEELKQNKDRYGHQEAL